MAQGRISPAKILSTDTERVTWLGLCDRFLPGADGFNFKMLFKVCFLSAAPYDSLRWTVQSSPSGRIKVGKGPDQHLFVTMEHFFSFFFSGKCNKGAWIFYWGLGEEKDLVFR